MAATARPLRPTLIVIGAIVATMVTLVCLSVPLYRLFCSVTGAGGTTQRVAADDAIPTARQVTVFFNTDVAPGLPWRFEPLQRSITLHLGQQVPVWFTATNLTDHAIVGHSTFNVTPDKVGIYFKKIQCFCFTEERLAPHETVQMPVQFFVDPRLAGDPDTQDVDQITLSYTFFQSTRPAGAKDLGRLDTATADPSLGRILFAANCGACHALDRNKVGPALAGIVGRTAGTAASYPYSSALAKSGIVWTPEHLDAWLQNPQVFVPGAMMPMSVASTAERRDIIAWLARPGARQPDPAGVAGPRIPFSRP